MGNQPDFSTRAIAGGAFMGILRGLILSLFCASVLAIVVCLAISKSTALAFCEKSGCTDEANALISKYMWD